MKRTRNRFREAELNHDRWLVSYADFMTLLFAFFVVLFASAYRDNQSVRRLSHSIHNGFQTMGAFAADESGYGGPYGSVVRDVDDNLSRVQNDKSTDIPPPTGSAADMLDLHRQLESAMGMELKNHEVVLQVTPEGFVISLKELGFFNSGQAVLLPGASEKLEKLAKVLMRPGLEIRVEGHSDTQPIHNPQFESNWDLSTARSMTVLRLLVNDAGFDPKKISAAGYGEYRPAADNSTVEGRRANRRVDLIVVQSRAPIATDR